MSNSHWRNVAKPIIERAIAEYGDKDTPELRKELSRVYPFGAKSHHPYKIWLSEIKRQLGTDRKRDDNQLYF